jgi:predicted HicB family RNase H-like nuclease
VSTKTKALNVRVKTDTYRRYKKAAKARKVSMATVVREKLESK